MATNKNNGDSSPGIPPSSSSTLPAPTPWTLHDYVSLGEIERGLSATAASASLLASSSSSSLKNDESSEEEIQRLPVFLRLLSTTRDLVSLSIDLEDDEEEYGDSRAASKGGARGAAAAAAAAADEDPLIRQTVERLEHVAAIHSVAEGVDVVTCYLVPTMTRKLSRVPPLVARKNRSTSGGGDSVLDTTELSEVARNPKGRYGGKAGGGSRSRKRDKVTGHDAQDGVGEGGDSVDDDGDGEDDESSSGGGFSDNEEEMEVGGNNNKDEEGDRGSSKGKKRKRKGGTISRSGSGSVIDRRSSLEVAAEDSQEATVVKTLSELVSLVVTSLEPIVAQHSLEDHHHDDRHNQQHSKETAAAPSENHGDLPASEKPNFSQEEAAGTGSSGGKGQLALTIEDSILAETGRDGTGGAMELSDLGSTVAAIMHHAPALRSRHVANALCRASIPQVANILTRMGANCPASVPSLLAGCIQAYQLATSIVHQNTSIANVAKQGVLALAKLSPREKSRVIHKLQSKGIMWDVQLELAIQDPIVDSTAAPTILVHQIIGGGRTSSTPESTSAPPPIPRISYLDRQQSAGEEPSDEYPKLDDGDESRTTSTLEPTLLSLLLKRPQLYRKTLEFLAQQFQILSLKKRLPRGQLVLFLKAYNCLLLCPTTTTSSGSKFDRSKFLFETVLPALQALVDKVLEILVHLGEQSELPPTSNMDPLVESLQCAVLLSTARIVQSCGNSSSPNNDKSAETCQELNIFLGELPCPSQRVQGFRHGMEAAMSEEQPSVVHAQIVGVLASRQTFPTSPNEALAGTFSDIGSGLEQVCRLFKPLNQAKMVVEGGTLGSDLRTTLTSLMFRLDDENEAAVPDIDDVVKRALYTLLMSDEVCFVSCMDNGDLLPQFVSKATQRLVSQEGILNLPMVLSAPLERQSSVLNNVERANKNLDDGGAQYLLCLLHAFEYLNAKPESPFAFDPRSLPLKKALQASSLWCGDFLQTRLYELSTAHCMDVVVQLERARTVAIDAFYDAESSMFGPMPRGQGIEAFYKALQAFVVNIEKDTEACGSETIFLQAKSSLSNADLCSTVCSAFLTSPYKPRPTYTYHILCRDPLLLFKCPLRIWKNRGLRRIALSVLSSLLESNAVLVQQTSPIDTTVKEFLASRDVVVVRCLLMCICGVESDVDPSDCTMTSSFIRSLISCNEGVVATLIKQGLNERVADWLVEHVPECMNDSQEMQTLFSDRSSLTAAERLVAADVVLRIAIVHGQSNEEEATSMAYSALAQLVDCFFLVVGPVGVPVNALIVDDSGLDVTQISRKAAFRILRALMRVRGRRVGLRKECGMALQKLAGLCKSESVVAGVVGTVAGRRKQLLKEIYDLCIKAATNMGIPIGAQSTAA